EGTVTNSERRAQRVRRALEPPPGARDDIDIIGELAQRLGCGWGRPTAEQVWDECRRLSPMHAGMAYRRLDELGGLQWPCPDESHPGTQFLHARLCKEPAEGAEAVRASSRRGSVEVRVRYERSLRPGLAFMTLHFPDQVSTNVLTIDATDPKSGTAEFKASAIRIDKLTRVPAT